MVAGNSGKAQYRAKGVILSGTGTLLTTGSSLETLDTDEMSVSGEGKEGGEVKKKG